jgi:hypothetical protein
MANKWFSSFAPSVSNDLKLFERLGNFIHHKPGIDMIIDAGLVQTYDFNKCYPHTLQKVTSFLQT